MGVVMQTGEAAGKRRLMRSRYVRTFPPGAVAVERADRVGLHPRLVDAVLTVDLALARDGPKA